MMHSDFTRSCLLALGLVCMLAGSARAADGVDTSPLPIKTVRAFPNLKPRRLVRNGHKDWKETLSLARVMVDSQ